MIGVSENWLGMVINFNLIPKRVDGAATQKLLAFFDVEFSDIFPSAKLKLIAGERQVSRKIPKDKLVNWSREQFDELPAPQQDFQLARLAESIEAVLAKLNYKEEHVLVLRFGLKGKREHTLAEIGEQFGVTQERIRQIEAKALRKLRRPKLSKDLKLIKENLL